MSIIGDARLVLLGEASHGTHEFYRERARITERLIKEKISQLLLSKPIGLPPIALIAMCAAYQMMSRQPKHWLISTFPDLDVAQCRCIGFYKLAA